MTDWTNMTNAMSGKDDDVSIEDGVVVIRKYRGDSYGVYEEPKREEIPTEFCFTGVFGRARAITKAREISRGRPIIYERRHGGFTREGERVEKDVKDINDTYDDINVRMMEND